MKQPIPFLAPCGALYADTGEAVRFCNRQQMPPYNLSFIAFLGRLPLPVLAHRFDSETGLSVGKRGKVMEVLKEAEMLKYPSIENSYQQKYIAIWLKHQPSLADEQFIVTEKIHGSSFQVMFTPQKPVRFFSRNQEIMPGDKFHGYQLALQEVEMQSVFDYLQTAADMSGVEFRVFGELFGPGIMKGIKYGSDEKRFRIFDMVCGTEWVTQEELFCSIPALASVLVPHLGVMSLQAALDFDAEQPSTFLPDENNTWEGVVIKPYSKIYQSPEGAMFYLKKKSEKFAEKANERTPVALDDEVLEVNQLFVGYFNDNRVQSCFSKMGEIQEPKQMATYIKAVLEDGKADFLKDHAGKLEKLSKDQQKKALNLGGVIANLLKPYL
jgi:Rnl2 family RNA ligase